MDNKDLIEALEELFELQAEISSELDYDYSTTGDEEVQVFSGWSPVLKLMNLLDDISPELSYLQSLLEVENEL